MATEEEPQNSSLTRGLLSEKGSRVWYDLTMSLTYPSILGAVIYFFFDASIQVFGLPLLDRLSTLPSPGRPYTTDSPFHFFESLGFSTGGGFLIFLAITLLIVIHHSMDFLYSKYTEGHYDFKYFVGDTVISTLLAVAYITLSDSASSDIQHVKVGFVIFWLAFVGTYLIFIWWDTKAYIGLRNVDQRQAKFYLGMVRWFEVSAVVIFLALAMAPILITRVSWFSYAYVVTSIVVLATVSIWFCLKTYQLEVITRESNTGTDLLKTPSESPPNRETTITGLQFSDINDCAEIFVRAYQETYSERWTHDIAKTRLSELWSISPDYCFVLKINGIVAGFIVARPFVWYDGTRVWLEEIVIDTQYRGKGWGKALMQTLFEECRNRNVVGYALISEKSSNAFRIYKKMGFQISDWTHLEVHSDKLQ